jgi:hypothetical protein
LQCCHLLANYFGQIHQKIRPLAEKFGHTHYPFTEAGLQRLLRNKVTKNMNSCVMKSLFLPRLLCDKCTFKKVRQLFGHFLKNLPKIRPRIFPVDDIFNRATFVFCGLNFCQLATLILDIVEHCNIPQIPST